VRQAFQYAVNKQAIAGLLGKIGAVVTNSVLPPGVAYATQDVKTYPYDLAKARALLVQAGLSNGFSTQLVAFRSAIETPAQEIIQRSLSEVGVTMQIVTMEVGAWVAARPTAPMSTISQSFPPEPDFFLYSFFDSSNFPPGQNYMHYKNERVDELLEEGRTVRDPKRLETIYREVQQIIAEDSPAIPIIDEVVTLGIRKEIQGLKPGILIGMFQYDLYPVSKE
jgi:ABC-type transport system substrate-binding protein